MNTDWRRVSFLLAFQVVVFACAPQPLNQDTSKTLISSPSVAVSPVKVSRPAQTPPLASTPTKTIPAPTRTRPPLPEVGQIYPLVVGMTRVYSGSIEKLSLSSTKELEVTAQWTGVATETIKTLSYSNKQWQLISTWSYEPKDAEGIKLNPQSKYFVDEHSIYISGGIYSDSEVKWPLDIGQKWGERNFVDTGSVAGVPYWRVDEIREFNSTWGQGNYHAQVNSFYHPQISAAKTAVRSAKLSIKICSRSE